MLYRKNPFYKPVANKEKIYRTSKDQTRFADCAFGFQAYKLGRLRGKWKMKTEEFKTAYTMSHSNPYRSSAAERRFHMTIEGISLFLFTAAIFGLVAWGMTKGIIK